MKRNERLDEKQVLTAFACIVVDQQLRTSLDVLRQARRWLTPDNSPLADAVDLAVLAMRTAREKAVEISDGIMAEVNDKTETAPGTPAKEADR